jgi:hypothetical protein
MFTIAHFGQFLKSLRKSKASCGLARKSTDLVIDGVERINRQIVSGYRVSRP